MNLLSRNYIKFALIFGISVLANLLFTFLGAPFARVLRNVYGRRPFWFWGTLLAVGMLLVQPNAIVLAALLLGQWTTIGVYQEFEERGRAGLASAAWAVLVGTLTMMIVPALGAQLFGLDLVSLLRTGIEDSIRQMLGGKELAETGIKMDYLLGAIPGTLGALQVTTLAVGLMLDRRTAQILNVKFENIASRMKLLNFRLPDYFIWVAMISFLFSFLTLLPDVVRVVAINVLVVILTAYLFQGLAVMEYWFMYLRLGALPKALIYLLIVGQLFFLLSFVGLIDFWADFRFRIRRWSLSRNNQNNGETQ
jgi:hypothetical protein